MSFQNRREFLFVYTVKDANPNGDPLNANAPRYDGDSQQTLVSDVRVKRTMRDYWLQKGGAPVFVDGGLKQLDDRGKELMLLYGADAPQAALAHCIDVRLFGVTFSSKKKDWPFAWTGPLQFKWGRSLHKAKVELIQGTGAFTTGEGKDQRTFRNEYLTPFAALAVYAIANQNAAVETGATDEDLQEAREALWNGTINLISRSKVGHRPRLLLEIRYRAGYQGAVGGLDEMARLECDGRPLTDDEQLALRSLDGVTLNLERIAAALEGRADQVEQVTVWAERGLRLAGLDPLRQSLGSRLVVEER